MRWLALATGDWNGAGWGFSVNIGADSANWAVTPV